MSRMRASLLSITALSKVFSSSTKTLFLLRNLSTASPRLESPFRYGSLQSSSWAYSERNWSENQNDPVKKNSNFGGDYANADQQFGNEVEGSQVSKNPASTLEELDGFCKEGNVREAVEALKSLEEACVPVDLPRFVQLMRVCGDYGALEEAKDVHGHILRSHSPLEVSTYNKILEMYLKCGSIDDAFDVFDGMEIRNSTSWDTMIKWLADSGFGEEAIDVFTEFKQAGLKPDAQMFVRVISACKVVGDINEGMLHFESMKKDYGIAPSMEHYVRIVDMMGSNGYVDEALEFIQKMPMEPSLLVWETLMDLCRVQGHLELGNRCAENIEQLDPSYLSEEAKAGQVKLKAVDPSKGRESKGREWKWTRQKKERECKGGDRPPPELCISLMSLKEQMKEAGYTADTRLVCLNIDQESEEEDIVTHSVRVATANDFLTTRARSTVTLLNDRNRICIDCHNALKIMSKIVGRCISKRDEHIFHHIKNGVCSCHDRW